MQTLSTRFAESLQISDDTSLFDVRTRTPYTPFKASSSHVVAGLTKNLIIVFTQKLSVFPTLSLLHTKCHVSTHSMHLFWPSEWAVPWLRFSPWSFGINTSGICGGWSVTWPSYSSCKSVSPVSIIPPTLHTHLHAHVSVTGRTSGRSLGAFNRISEIGKRCVER